MIPEFRLAPRQAMLRMAQQWRDPEGVGSTFVLLPGNAAPIAESLPKPVQAAVEKSTTGAVLFVGRPDIHVVLPPFAPTEAAVLSGWDAAPLLSLLAASRTVGVLLLRRGGYGVGVFEDESLAVSKVGRRYVQGRTKKGGSSSGRFARRRGEQANALMEKTCDVLRQRLESYGKAIDHFLLGGDRLLLQAFRERCPYFKPYEGVVAERRLEVPDPSQSVLESLPRVIYSCRVVSLHAQDEAMPNTKNRLVGHSEG